MTPANQRRAALALALAAIGIWGWTLASGGIVRRPPPKVERGACADASTRSAAAERVEAVQEASDPRADALDRSLEPEPVTAIDPGSRIDLLTARIDGIERPRSARAVDLDRLWTRARAPVPRVGPDAGELGRVLTDQPFEGTCVREGLRIAAIGGRLLTEGDELEPGGARLVRIDAGSIVIARGADELRIGLGEREARRP